MTLAPEFVEAEVIAWLKDYRDENGDKLSPYEIKFLGTFANQIIKSYEKYGVYMRTKPYPKA